MRRVQFITCLLAGLLVWATASPAEARREGHTPHHDSARHERFSLDQAVSDVRRDTGGRVLTAQKREHGRGTFYRIKVLLPDASVRSFDVETRDHEGR